MEKNIILTPSWYALHTKSRFESVVCDLLIKKSIDAFLPKVRVKSKRRDRNVMLNTPLFPGYLFVNTDLNPDKHLEILKTTGAVKLIGNQNKPVPIPDEAVESLKIMVIAENPVATGSKLKKGDRVIVVSGPFTGVIGSFIRYQGKGRIVVNIEALGQFASVDVDEDDIEILPKLNITT